MPCQRISFAYGVDYKFDVDFLVREGLFDGDPWDLEMTDGQVAQLSWPERERRVLQLENLADLLFYQARQIARHHGGEREVAAVAGMLSGGRDSTAAIYVMSRHLTHLVQADTGKCLEVTRQFVREVAADLGLPLLVPRAPRPEDQYDTLVRERGFPGAPMHAKMYNRLKERAWEEARRQLISSGWRQRVIQVAGRRRSESDNRADVPEMQRVHSVVWVSPMVLWTKMDLNTYRKMYRLDERARQLLHRCRERLPVNRVYDLLHYSGECLCGSNARKGEREWLFDWFGDDPSVRELKELEAELAGREDIPAKRRVWGCGGGQGRCPSGICNE
jgi:3'-phosphoadenosine 5'-phosphosulfate sulfotransferase (PAPS reductase)/FAD synthetase